MTPNCCICSVSLESSKGTKVTKIAELLEGLFVHKLNFKLPEELIICDTCLIKVQSAYRFKDSYLENSQKLCIKQEGIENEVVCEICKENVNLVDCISLFYSVTEMDKENLFKYLFSELQLKYQDSPQTCELCHKSVLNFCIVIKSFSVFVQDTVTDLKSKVSNFGHDIIVNSEDSIDDSTIDIKKDLEIKEEPTTTYQDFLCTNEEFELKTEDEPIQSHTLQELGIIKYVSSVSQTNKSRSFVKHLITHKSNNVEMFKCQHCDYQTKFAYNFKGHLGTHKVEMFKCQICNFQTENKTGLKQHVNVHKNANEMFECRQQLCDYQTKYISNLKEHNMIVHKESDIKILKCQLCDYQTTFACNFKRHLSTHKVDLFKCQICHFQTRYKRSMIQHVNIHKDSNIAMLKCQIRNFQTDNKRGLKQHVSVHKNANEMVKCQQQLCDDQTKCINNLKEHDMIVHKESDDVKCQVCDYLTKTKKDLDQHRIVHENCSDIEMFKCHICDYQTKYKSNHKIHLLVHKDSNEMKMLKCRICDYETNNIYYLNKHMIVHKDCNIAIL